MSTVAIISTEPTSLVAVNDQCARVELWAETCESIPELQDASNKLAAINEYLERTSTEGRARVEASRRRLEVRIGKLLGPAIEAGHRSDLKPLGREEGGALNHRQRHDFRQMADNEEIVEQVIAESTDTEPASRRRVMQAVPLKGNAARDARDAEIREMARKGFSSIQIAHKFGYTRQARVKEIAKRLGIEIPADAARVKSKFDHDRIIATLVHDLEGARIALNLLDYTELDSTRIEGWVDSLTESIRILQKLKTNLVKESTREER